MTSTVQQKVFKVPEDISRNLLHDMGHPNARSMTVEKIENCLNHLPQRIGVLHEPENRDHLRLMRTIFSALADNLEIEVTEKVKEQDEIPAAVIEPPEDDDFYDDLDEASEEDDAEQEETDPDQDTDVKIESDPSTVTEVQPRKRGRPKGSKNKVNKTSPVSIPVKRPLKRSNKAKTGRKPVRKAKRRLEVKRTPAKASLEDNEIDNFGSRIGSTASRINAMLSKKPLTMREIMKELNTDETYYNHLNKLISGGHVEKTKKGYVLV